MLVSRGVVHEGCVAALAEEVVRVPEVAHRLQTTIDDRLTTKGALGREEGEVTLGAVRRAVVLVEELLHYILPAVRTVEVFRMPDSSQCRYHLSNDRLITV